MNHDGKQEALGADQDVPFASSQFLAAVKPAHSSHQRFDRLTVNDCGAGSGVTSSMEAGQLPQLRMNADPRPIQPPLAEIPVHGLPGPIRSRQIAPRAATAEKVEESVHDAPHVARSDPR
jgi:hypothetical protein